VIKSSELLAEPGRAHGRTAAAAAPRVAHLAAHTMKHRSKSRCGSRMSIHGSSVMNICAGAEPLRRVAARRWHCARAAQSAVLRAWHCTARLRRRQAVRWLCRRTRSLSARLREHRGWRLRGGRAGFREVQTDSSRRAWPSSSRCGRSGSVRTAAPARWSSPETVPTGSRS
jgi:hypothetical protein